MVIGPTKAMSVMACRAIRLNIGQVPVTRAAKNPARRFTKRETTRYTAQSASTPNRQKGTRTAHSVRESSAISPGSFPGKPMRAMCMPMLISQKVSTGLDQNTSASRGDPGHQRLMKSPRLVIWRATSE